MLVSSTASSVIKNEMHYFWKKLLDHDYSFTEKENLRL